MAQCKHTSVGRRVTSRTMYEVKGTAGPVHGADIAVVATNGAFTRDARAWGDRNDVHWIDRDKLPLGRRRRLPLRVAALAYPVPPPG